MFFYTYFQRLLDKEATNQPSPRKPDLVGQIITQMSPCHRNSMNFYLVVISALSEGQTLASVWKLNILLLGGLCPLSSTGETPSSSLKPLPLILFCNDDDDGDSDGEWRWWWCYGQSGERHLQECRIIPHYPPPTLKRTPSIHNPQSSLSPSLSSSVSQQTPHDWPKKKLKNSSLIRDETACNL